MSRKVILYIAMSLDGYIAKPNDDLSFLSIIEKEGEDYGYQQFEDSIDVVVMGRKTYNWIIQNVDEEVYSGKKIYVLTKSKESSPPNVTFFWGDLKDLVRDLKNEGGRDIFCVGGAEVVTGFFASELIEEIYISVVPILLGEGKRLFRKGIPEQNLRLVDSKSFDTGLVELHYKVVRNND